MGHLRIKSNKCGYKEEDRMLKEQLINDIKNDDMMIELIRELTTIKKNSELAIEHILYCARRVEAERAQKSI